MLTKTFKFFFRIFMLAALGALIINIWIVYTSKGLISEADNFSSDGQKYDCIIVLGAKVYSNAQLSSVLQDRMDVAIDLYFKDAAPKLLLSGDHGTVNYDEVNAMKNYALKRGVKIDDIFLDHAGFSTYESIFRAKEIFGIVKPLIVSQRFHLYRAVFISRALKISGIGVSSALRPYAKDWYSSVREFAARPKDFLYVYLLKPNPTYLGETYDISGTGQITHD